MCVMYAIVCFFVFEIKGITVSINPGLLIIFILIYAVLIDVDIPEFNWKGTQRNEA